MQEYITISGDNTAEYEEKHSRFIATCFHCETEQEASEIIAAQKSKYWDARHNVYAY
ncbi:MAG: YigZ family protein, partial [Clostridia bacterium]|nr:YigZ family protein [Clostridia bacterium]